MKVSIITVCLNSESTIEKTIKSVISQNYFDCEYLIIDGGSEDKTLSIINKFKKNIDYFISEKDNGLYDAINKGISKSNGDIICILHSDDIFFEDDTISKVIKYFELNPNLECLIGNTLILDRNSKKIIRKYKSNIFKKWMLYLGFSPPHPSTFLKKKVYEKIGLYKITYKIASDFDFFVKIFMKNLINSQLVDENFILMKSGGKSSSSFKSNFIASKEIYNSLKNNNLYSNIILIILRIPIKLIQYFVK